MQNCGKMMIFADASKDINFIGIKFRRDVKR